MRRAKIAPLERCATKIMRSTAPSDPNSDPYSDRQNMPPRMLKAGAPVGARFEQPDKLFLFATSDSYEA